MKNIPCRYISVFWLSVFLSACSVNGIPGVVFWPKAIPAIIADKTSDEYRARQAGKRELQRLVRNKDVEGSARCMMGECSWTHVWGNFPDREKNILLSSRTVIDNWSEEPQNITQIISVMEAYSILARDIRKQNPEEARKYYIKGLSYLQNDKITNLFNLANFTSSEGKNFNVALTSSTMHLLGGLVERDYEKMECTYPAEIKNSINFNKFSNERSMWILKLSCWNSNRDIDYKSFTVIWAEQRPIP